MTAYYNEFDPFAAAWLRELIADGLIAEGEVDERSILDVSPDDLRGYRQHHFFAGIGGWSYALRLAGWGDDRPVWTGSCPCQPFSSAGKRKGHADERHLWPAFYALIAECRPSVVFGEQVASKLGREWLAGVRADLEALGYACGAADLCAASAGAPHIRQRLFWVADALRLARGLPILKQGPRQDCFETERRREAGGVAQSDQGQCGRLADGEGRQHDGQTPGRQQGDGEPQSGGSICGVGNAQSKRRDGREDTAGPRGRSGAQDDGRMGDTDDPRPQVGGGGLDQQPHSEGRQAKERPDGLSGFWSRAEFIPCADGKARRIEPGVFPLAHGIHNRVGTLRGAGNAIVPQVAAAFVRAASET